ncbi:MAG: hypothetical protein VXX86_10020 [Planctomycetota bacterium]|nr:hypothetical protein [Planctomycetota bacterium]
MREKIKHQKNLLIVMRVNFEKPRTTVGWYPVSTPSLATVLRMIGSTSMVKFVRSIRSVFGRGLAFSRNSSWHPWRVASPTSRPSPRPRRHLARGGATDLARDGIRRSGMELPAITAFYPGGWGGTTHHPEFGPRVGGTDPASRGPSRSSGPWPRTSSPRRSAPVIPAGVAVAAGCHGRVARPTTRSVA